MTLLPHVSAAGQGNIGLDAFTTPMRDERLDAIPMVLETIDPSIWAEEIAWLRAQQATDGD